MSFLSEIGNNQIQDILEDMGMLGQLHPPKGGCLPRKR